jgi:hypothetical protein
VAGLLLGVNPVKQLVNGLVNLRLQEVHLSGWSPPCSSGQLLLVAAAAVAVGRPHMERSQDWTGCLCSWLGQQQQRR